MSEDFTIADKYTLTFRGPVQREVLKDIALRICGYGSTIDPNDAAQVAQYNVAVDILATAGIHPQDLFSRPIAPKVEENSNSVNIKHPFVRKVVMMLGLGK